MFFFALQMCSSFLCSLSNLGKLFCENNFVTVHNAWGRLQFLPVSGKKVTLFNHQCINGKNKNKQNTCCFTSVSSPSSSLCETLVCSLLRVLWRPMRSTPWRWGRRSSSQLTRTGTTAAPGRRGRVKAAARTPPSPNTPSTRRPASRRACR